MRSASKNSVGENRLRALKGRSGEIMQPRECDLTIGEIVEQDDGKGHLQVELNRWELDRVRRKKSEQQLALGYISPSLRRQALSPQSKSHRNGRVGLNWERIHLENSPHEGQRDRVSNVVRSTLNEWPIIFRLT